MGRKAIETNDSSPWGYNAKGLSAAGLGQMDEAIETIEAGLAINPGNADLLLGYAVTAMKRSDYTDAVAKAEAAIHHNPFPPGFYYSVLSRAYEGNDDFAIIVEDTGQEYFDDSPIEPKKRRKRKARKKKE